MNHFKILSVFLFSFKVGIHALCSLPDTLDPLSTLPYLAFSQDSLCDVFSISFCLHFSFLLQPNGFFSDCSVFSCIQLVTFITLHRFYFTTMARSELIIFCILTPLDSKFQIAFRAAITICVLVILNSFFVRFIFQIGEFFGATIHVTAFN